MFTQKELEIIRDVSIPAALHIYDGFRWYNEDDLYYRRKIAPLFYKIFTNTGFRTYAAFKKNFIDTVIQTDKDKSNIDKIVEPFTYLPSENMYFSTKQYDCGIYNATVRTRYINPFFQKDSVELQKRYKKILKYFGEYFSKENILFETKKGATKKGWLKDLAQYIDTDTSFKLLKEGRVIPSYFLKTHKFSEEQLIDIIKSHPDFKNKSAVMGGSQDKRTNASNHILKWQTVSLKVLKTILEVGFPNEEDAFLRSMAKRKITMQNIEQTDEFINSLIDAGAKFTYINTEKASDATKLIIEVNS